MEEANKLETKQFVVFKLGNEEYGIDTSKVTTIVRMMTIARVPKTPDFIKGVINLRGEIIPIMDLRARFHLEAIEHTEDTRITIIKVEEVVIGIIVDAVTEVMQFADDDIENVTNFSNNYSLDYIYGIGKMNERIITLLNLEKLVKIL